MGAVVASVRGVADETEANAKNIPIQRGVDLLGSTYKTFHDIQMHCDCYHKCHADSGRPRRLLAVLFHRALLCSVSCVGLSGAA